MVLKKTVFIWYEVEITLFQNINSKGMPHIWLIKLEKKQIRINNVHLKKFTNMNLLLTY